jgi:hypothetical protein
VPRLPDMMALLNAQIDVISRAPTAR